MNMNVDATKSIDTIESKELIFTDTTNEADNMLTMALKALRLDFRKVSQTGKSSVSGKYDNLPEISLDEVANHDSIEDCWVVVYDRVYDVTKFLDTHPGGWDVIIDYAGMDCTIAFRGTGHSKEAIDLLDKFLIGKLPIHQQIFRKINGVFQLSDMPE